MAEDLTDYMRELGIRVHIFIRILIRWNGQRSCGICVWMYLMFWLESTFCEKVWIFRKSRLVAILDADKEGFLRSRHLLIQTIGRAARNAKGHVIMYADKMTDSMKMAIE